MSDARERAREALKDHQAWRDGDGICESPPLAYADWFNIVRDLLAVEPGMTVGTWAWAVEQMLAENRVRLRSWHDDYIEIDRYGTVVAKDESDYNLSVEHMTATDWEVVPPPPPAIKRGTPVKGVYGATGVAYGYYVCPAGGGHEITMFKDGSGQSAFVDRVEPLEGAR